MTGPDLCAVFETSTGSIVDAQGNRGSLAGWYRAHGRNMRLLTSKVLAHSFAE